MLTWPHFTRRDSSTNAVRCSQVEFAQTALPTSLDTAARSSASSCMKAERPPSSEGALESESGAAGMEGQIRASGAGFSAPATHQPTAGGHATRGSTDAHRSPGEAGRARYGLHGPPTEPTTQRQGVPPRPHRRPARLAPPPEPLTRCWQLAHRSPGEAGRACPDLHGPPTELGAQRQGAPARPKRRAAHLAPPPKPLTRCRQLGQHAPRQPARQLVRMPQRAKPQREAFAAAARGGGRVGGRVGGAQGAARERERQQTQRYAARAGEEHRRTTADEHAVACTLGLGLGRYVGDVCTFGASRAGIRVTASAGLGE
eukprot:scaffold70391_cov66-Phaeocystis_antarctica.AAC.1